MRSLISLIFCLQLFLPSHAYSSGISKQEYCREFKQLAFPLNDTVFSRWESKKIKVLLIGEPEDLSYAKELLTKFSALTGKEIIYTDKNINVALVFREDLYRYALVMGEKFFKTWYPTNIEVYKFLQQSAKKGAWYFLLQKSNSVTNGVLSSVGIFEVPASDGNHLTTEDIRERIDIAITNTFFPHPNEDSVISFEGYEKEYFSPLTNKLHRPFAKMWYDPNLRPGSKFKEENMPNDCNS